MIENTAVFTQLQRSGSGNFHFRLSTFSTRPLLSPSRRKDKAVALSKPAKDVERLWTLEAVGVSDSSKEEFSALELTALRQFWEGLVYDRQHYTVALPKRESIVHLANNL